jgi:hypothetical protein
MPDHWTPRVTKDLLLSKHRYFVNVQLWPLEAKLDVHGWLENFDSLEEPYAITLLNGFTYYSRLLTERLFFASIANLSQIVLPYKRSFLRARSDWRDFISQAYFVRVTGEQPSDTDSGYIFSRMARQEAGIPEERIVTPDAVIGQLLLDPSISVVFMDDFVGSGNQFITLWHRADNVPGRRATSFSALAKTLARPSFYYCPLVCTSHGLREIHLKCNSVHVCPTHLMDDRYNALSTDSIIWPSDAREAGQRFVAEASRRAGIRDEGGGVNDWRGFHKLGLTIAFEHGPPDATLPLFYWEENGWRPLVRRR